MTNKIPYIAPFGRADITQEQAETEIITSDKMSDAYIKYITTLDSQLKIQDIVIDKLEKKYKRAIDIMFASHIFIVILIFTLYCMT